MPGGGIVHTERSIARSPSRSPNERKRTPKPMPTRALVAGGSGSNLNAPSSCTVPVTAPADGVVPVTVVLALS